MQHAAEEKRVAFILEFEYAEPEKYGISSAAVRGGGMSEEALSCGGREA